MTKGNHLRDECATAQGGRGNEGGLERDPVWASGSGRLLRTIGLRHTLGVEMESPDLNRENIPIIQTLQGCYFGPIKVEALSWAARPAHPGL